MLYHGLIVIGISAILLLIYNFIIVRWCASRHSSATSNSTSSSTSLQSSTQATKTFNSNQGISMMLPIFKYKKESDQGGSYDQCSVCLSVFEEAEDLKLLPRCKHSFHKQCIDMWLYSHLDCPICRSTVLPSAPQQMQKPNEQSVAAARQDMDRHLNMV